VPTDVDPLNGGWKWAASWSSAVQGPLLAGPLGSSVSPYDPQPDLSFAFPRLASEGAEDQTLRLIVKPDRWSDVVRVRLSNVFGDRPVTFGAVTVALQEYQANLVAETSTPVTFDGHRAVTVPPGERVFSDPVRLAFADSDVQPLLAGRNLAVSLAVAGATGPLSSHLYALETSFLSPPYSGDVTRVEDDRAFPYTTTSYLFLDAVDAAVPDDTLVVCAFGDSITDGTFSTPGGHDRWSNAMSRRLHAASGQRFSVVNQGIGGNAVALPVVGPPATKRFSRDVLGLSGLDTVVWLQGINDIGVGRASAESVIAGYELVAQGLHAAGVRLIGATLPPALAPSAQPPPSSPLVDTLTLAGAAHVNGSLVDSRRRVLNDFIRSSAIFDGWVDFAALTEDPETGTLKPEFVPNSGGSLGDYLHPNRAAYQVMGEAAAEAVLRSPMT
jgi:lysophospholipase L1-like esterase